MFVPLVSLILVMCGFVGVFSSWHLALMFSWSWYVSGLFCSLVLVMHAFNSDTYVCFLVGLVLCGCSGFSFVGHPKANFRAHTFCWPPKVLIYIEDIKLQHALCGPPKGQF